jgi:hypothetical protein
MEDLKFMIDFSVDKPVTKEVITQKEVDGEKAEVKKTYRQKTPVKVSIRKPNRKISEGAEIYYAKLISQYIKEGLLSVHMLAKRYDNDGGPMNDTENKIIDLLVEQKDSLSSEYMEIVGDDDKEKELNDEQKERVKEILQAVVNIEQQIESLKNPYSEIFNQTAEYKARNKTVTWWMMHLTYLENEEGKNEQLFNGAGLEEKLNQLDELEESDDKFKKEVARKAVYFISYWLNGGNTDKEHIEQIAKSYSEEFSDYDVETDEIPEEKPQVEAKEDQEESQEKKAPAKKKKQAKKKDE